VWNILPELRLWRISEHTASVSLPQKPQKTGRQNIYTLTEVRTVLAPNTNYTNGTLNCYASAGLNQYVFWNSNAHGNSVAKQPINTVWHEQLQHIQCIGQYSRCMHLIAFESSLLFDIFFLLIQFICTATNRILNIKVYNIIKMHCCFVWVWNTVDWLWRGEADVSELRPLRAYCSSPRWWRCGPWHDGIDWG
jgi:hypothetical protein